MTDIMQRAAKASRSAKAAAVGASKRPRNRRNTKLGPSVRGPLVFKFRMDDSWVFIVARNRAEARRHPSLPRGETVWLPTLEELTRFAVAIIREHGDCIRVPQYNTRGQEPCLRLSGSQQQSS